MDDAKKRTRSPRAPSISLKAALERVASIYEKERCNSVPLDVAAKHLGYSGANNGKAASLFATLGYYSLIDRPQDGYVRVSKEYQAYMYAPDDGAKHQYLRRWLISPSIFNEIFEKYADGLPSEQTLKFDLIQKGFSPQSADECQAAYRESFSLLIGVNQEVMAESNPDPVPSVVPSVAQTLSETLPPAQIGTSNSDGSDRIPVRLSGGRRAWIDVPSPFYQDDKERLKKQIDLIFTDDPIQNGGSDV